ncbi:MAG: SNF2-related protein [Nitrospira sp.]|nr:SNF2-related protein [Nitrospira sp.]
MTKPQPGNLKNRSWKRFLRGPDPALLDELYVPALMEAVRYDRCCAYFSSTVLAAAARGFGRLIERLEAIGESAPHPAVRLVVNEELAEEDVRALTETGDLSSLEVLLEKRFKTPKDILEKKRLAMLGWLVKQRLLEVRVGVMRRGEGIVHAKFGIVTDEAGETIVFNGSGNESAQGLLGNYERLEVSTSWEDPGRYREYAEEFESLWRDTHPDVHTVTLPEALRLRLVKFAPKEPPITDPSNAMARQKAAMIWRFIVEAPYLPDGGATCDATAMVDLWPHQRRVVQETAEAWPEGRLLCDEVGMGKTIEAILVLRRLMAGRGVRRALILLPAGLLKQWQTELREKGGMLFPRLEGTTTLVWPDERTEKVNGVADALERDVLLMSRETARTENNLPLLLASTPWDLVVLDESHAARRREQEEGEFNSGTLLLTLLRRLQLRRRVRGFLLLSATPMQTHPWEPWDLLTVLGEGGAWLTDFTGVRDFYAAVAAVRNGRCDIGTARKAAALIAADPLFPASSAGLVNTTNSATIAKALAFVTSTKRDEIARWLRQGSPLARRMHRNTRGTLQRYYEMGLLPDPPPQRVVEDILFDFQDSAEREVYNAVSRYIEKRFAELEKEKPGKGFVMTIYRRRASSSPYSLERSLKRRQDGLRRIADHKAYDQELAIGEGLDPKDLDDIGGFEGVVRVSAALPSDPKVALAELNEVDRVLADLHELSGKDSKRDRFFDVLRRITDDGRPVLVFTEYTDTLEYVRDNLVSHYGKGLGCYSGDGGQLWDGNEWYPVTKDTITLALRNGELRALVCTDAASEGLNLQAAGAVINYDLPWNPSKVEQRIGRIDRIGQQLPQIRVINLFLKDSVDDKVYRALRTRCGLFEHFVGSMQPVLAQARRMLLGQDTMDLRVLQTAASQIERDPLASETYIESQAQGDARAVCPVMRAQIESALGYLNGEFGPQVKSESAGAKYILSGPGISRTIFASTVPALEHDRAALPLSPLEPKLRELAEGLVRPGERLPLVIGSYQSGAFRNSMAYWLDDREKVLVESLEDLERRVKAWSGQYPDPESWLQAERAAQVAAEEQVRNSERLAAKREREGLERQTAAARLRLQRELGRYLACLEAGTADLNGLLHKQMSRDISSAQRLKRCLEKLGGYPDWNSDLCQSLQNFADQLTDNQRRARLLGKELDAALDDPRWLADSKGD